MRTLTLSGEGSEGKRVLLCGYYGEHNLGDDALLEALIQQLPAAMEPVVTARDQAQVQRRHGVATTDRRRLASVLTALGRCDALVLGGGSLLQDATSFTSLLYYAALIAAARVKGKPVGLWAQGLGPLRRRRSRALVRQLLRMATAISWRDEASASLAAELVAGRGATSLLGSDPVWGLPPRRWLGRGGPIVVCWRPTPLLQGQRWKPYLKALDSLSSSGDRPVHWLPFHGDQDLSLYDELRSQGLISAGLQGRSLQLRVDDPDEALDRFSGAGLVLAMRLHALILAALAGAPVAALSYDPKVSAAAAGLGCPCQELQDAPPADLGQRWLACLDQPVDPGVISRLSVEAGRHRQVLERLLEAASGSAGA